MIFESHAHYDDSKFDDDGKNCYPLCRKTGLKKSSISDAVSKAVNRPWN